MKLRLAATRLLDLTFTIETELSLRNRSSSSTSTLSLTARTQTLLNTLRLWLAICVAPPLNRLDPTLLNIQTTTTKTTLRRCLTTTLSLKLNSNRPSEYLTKPLTLIARSNSFVKLSQLLTILSYSSSILLRLSRIIKP